MIDIVNFTYSYTGHRNDFDMSFKPVTRPVMNWVDEISNTIKTIRSSTDKKLFLCLSGGIDGEVIARMFIKNNVYFEAISLRHASGSNQHDIVYAINFCKEHNIKHHIIDFDIEKFIVETIPEYIDQGYISWRPFRFQQIHLFKIAESMGGVAILGGGEQMYFTIDGKISLVFKEDFFMCLEWLRRNNKTHFPYFFMQNPEVFASYMQVDLIDFLLQRPEYFINVWPNNSYEKMDLYHRFFPEMPRRRKFNGFENLRATDLFKKYVFGREEEQGKLKELAVPVEKIKSQLKI